MNNDRSRKVRAAFALMLGAASTLFAVSAYAQDTAASKDEEPQKLEKFVVTGSYLPVSASVTASPIVTLQSSEIGKSGATDALNLLKQMTPFFAGNNNLGTESNNGYGGESNVALRNLPTLVLINGQRMTTSPFSNQHVSSGPSLVDLNNIPVAMIDRIEILKDGASTVYGSDAIGGVVNVILRQNYNGFEAAGRYGSTRNGDYKTREVHIMGGVSQPGFSLVMGAEHFENTSLLTTDRPLTTMSPAQITALGFNVTSAVYSGSFPGRVNSDILAGSPLAVGAPGFNASIVTPPAKTNPNAAGQTLAQLEAAGIYIPISTTPASIAAGSASILNTTLFGNPLIVNTTRNEFIANANKELIGKNLEVFGDFLFAQTKNGGGGLAPTPITGVGAGGANSLSIPANNPYNLFGITIGIGQPAGAPTARSRTVELGKRSTATETNTFRFVGGLKGKITDQYSWEAIYNYSRASATENTFGGANGSNMNQLMIPQLDAGGNYVYNAAGRPLSVFTDSTGNHLPVYDLFALPGFNDQATLNAIRTTLLRNESANLRDISVRLKGTPFEVPGGDLSFALGVETRAEDIAGTVDGLFANGLAIGYNPAKTSGGSRSTKGAFLELGVPIISPKMGIPGVYTADLNLADRIEKISPGGNANTPKLGLRWLPVDQSFLLRATYAKGFLAPSIFSLFGAATGNSPTLTTFQGDGSSGSGGTLTKTVVVQAHSSELANPYLSPSRSKSYTAGFVYSPKQVKGLTLTVDYYFITQDKVGPIDYTGIAADLNAKGAGSVYAQDPLKLGAGFVFADGTTLTTNAPNQVNSTNFGTVSVVKNPAGDEKTEGLDIGLNYTFKTETIGSFNVGLNANILFNWKFRPTSSGSYLQYARAFTDSTTGGAGYSGLLPGYIIKPYINYTYKAFSSSLFMSYYPTVNEPGSLFGGASTTNSYTVNGLASHSPSYFTADFTLAYTLPSFGKDWLRNTTLSVGANNVFNKKPPYIPGDGSFVAENNTVKSAYDIIGRFIFAEMKKTF